MNRHLTIFFSITIILLYSLEVLSQKSINLNGVTDYIAVDNNPSLSIEGNFTIEAWIKPNDITGEKTILIKGNNGQCGNYGLFIKDGNLAYVSAGECGWNGRGANSSLTVGIWQHVAVATDNNIIRLYIDGALRDEITLSSTVGSTNFDELWIGRSVFITTNFFFDGLIDEVRIWDTSKSQTDIQNNLNTELSGLEPNLLLYYKLDDFEARCDITDCSINENHGSRINIDNETPPQYVNDYPSNLTDVACGVTFKEDTAPNAGDDGELTICVGDPQPNEAALFAALTGADSGGSWSGPVNGIYTYTIAASGTCPEDSATVTVKEDNANGCTSLQSEFQDFVDSVLFNLQPENASSFLNDQTAVTSVIQELQYYYANRSEIVDEYYDFLADLCGVYPQFFNINQTFDDVQFKYLGSFREQVHIYLRDYLRYYPDKEPQFISALDLSNGNAAKYFDIWNDFGILVIDNYSLDQTQLDVLYNLLTTIPTGSTNLGVIMFREFYTNDYVNALYITQSVSFINSFGLRVGSSPDYGFPADFDSFTSDTFSIALSHEICHTIDADYIGTNTRLNTWKNNLLSAAGTRYSEFLRTRVLDVGGNDFFQVYPQEFFASLANVFFSNSQLTLNLAIQRFNEGYKQPINQFLLMADALSVETNQTQFYVIDEVSNIDLTYYDIERNGNGFISKIFLNTQCLEFVYDENNFVIEINDGGCAITFPYNAFILYTETPACPNVEDGLIELSASSNTQGFVFDVQLTGNGRNETYTDALSFSSNVSIVDLASGTYTLSISLDEGYNIVYDEVVIGEPADLSAKRQRVDKTSSMAYYNVSGSESYTVTVNNLTHQYQVGSKGDHSLAVPISKSVNTITIKGAECQSVYQDLISAYSVIIHPNPVEDGFFLTGGYKGKILIYSSSGIVVKTIEVRNTDEKYISLGEFAPGVYFIALLNQQNEILKVIKK